VCVSVSSSFLTSIAIVRPQAEYREMCLAQLKMHVNQSPELFLYLVSQGAVLSLITMLRSRNRFYPVCVEASSRLVRTKHLRSVES
jgi:hypothetical protein